MEEDVYLFNIFLVKFAVLILVLNCIRNLQDSSNLKVNFFVWTTLVKKSLSKNLGAPFSKFA